MYQVDQFASLVIKRVDNVELSVANAFSEMDRIPSDPCASAGRDEMKRITYDNRFVEDVGVSVSGTYCSASKGTRGLKKLVGNPRAVQNDYLLYENQTDFIGSQSAIDLIVKGDKYVLLSPFAYSDFEDLSRDLGAYLYSKKNDVQLKKLSEAVADGAGRRLIFCSQTYDVCLIANVQVGLIYCRDARFAGLAMLFYIWSVCWGFLEFRKLRDSSSRLEHRLRRAIEKKLIGVEYQPIVNAGSGCVVGFEALARWYDEKLGYVSPEVFFRQATALGLSMQLTFLVIEKSLGEFSTELRSNRSLYLSINLRVSELTNPNVAEYIALLGRRFDIEPAQIAIELLEEATASLQSIETGINNIRRSGFKVFIDDFGSGYSSLAYLSMLRVDSIKIDKVFTSSAGTESPSAYILVKVCEIAQSLGAYVVFEGVESNEQREAILQFCPSALLQGWLFSKAVPMHQVASLLGRENLLPERQLALSAHTLVMT